jgi:hypothetical protein
MNFKQIILEDKDLSDVDVEEGKMSDILGVPEDETIEDGYDGSAQDAAEELVDAVGEQEAAGMINYAANISGNEFLEDMQDALKNIDESSQFRSVVRDIIKQELSEMTTTAAGGGYQTPFAFSDEDDEEREEDMEEFMDKYGYEMAELAKKAREEGLNESEREDLQRYIRKVKSMRDGDVAGYKKKSNYLPHNLEESVTQAQVEELAKEIESMNVETEIRSSPNGFLQLYVGTFSPNNQVESLEIEGGKRDPVSGRVMGKMINAGNYFDFAHEVAQTLNTYGIR